MHETLTQSPLEEPLFGTKAETLARFRPRLTRGRVLDAYAFTVAAWKADPAAVRAAIAAELGPARLAVRSSAVGEDGAAASLAGAFKSCLDVDGGDAGALTAAIDSVVASYGGNPHDQVLVQPMLSGVALSGVVMTHDLASGAPYYVINYDDESGKTDLITGGVGVNKTVVIHRDCPAAYVDSPRVREILAMVQELEAIVGDATPLDIEFAMTGPGDLILLQVRRIAVQKNWNRHVAGRVSSSLTMLWRFVQERGKPRAGLVGRRSILGQMPDWNPAEIIGTGPRPLAVSLYRTLVMDEAWREARASMGYRRLPPEPLMVLLAGRPYVDVRNSFNSFLPAGLTDETAGLLVDAWLDRLAAHPELHDKVEFQVALTALDFCHDLDLRERYPDVLSAAQAGELREALRTLTLGCLTGDSLPRALAAIAELERRQHTRPRKPALWSVRALVTECRELGTQPFAVIARHAFIAESLLRSAVRRGALGPERLEAFKRSLTTVAGELTRDFGRVLAGGLSQADFLADYGHLRPGTYDILSPRYDQREDLFRHAQPPGPEEPKAGFALRENEREGLAGLLAEAGLDGVSPDALLAYAARAIVERERAKFVFTRNLSDVLEAIAIWGESTGLTRDDLSYLRLEEVLDTLEEPLLAEADEALGALIDRRRRDFAWRRHISLGYLIRDERDLYVAPLHRSAPNFVTTQSLEGPIVVLDGRSGGGSELFGKVVCIENADPGFDWIFTRGIAGLVSKFGGANSHMTIRCAELGIPAAIGVGEQTFERLVAAGCVELRCGDRVVRPAAYG